MDRYTTVAQKMDFIDSRIKLALGLAQFLYCLVCSVMVQSPITMNDFPLYSSVSLHAPRSSHRGFSKWSHTLPRAMGSVRDARPEPTNTLKGAEDRNNKQHLAGRRLVFKRRSRREYGSHHHLFNEYLSTERWPAEQVRDTKEG